MALAEITTLPEQQITPFEREIPSQEEDFRIDGVFAGPDPEQGIFGKLNASHLGDRHVILRIIDHEHQTGKPDLSSLGLYDCSNGKKTYREILRRDDLPKGIVNLEDPRALEYTEGQVVIGVTAVDEKYQPLPALIYGKYPYRDSDFQVEILKELGHAKNVTPMDTNTLFFREEGEAGDNTITIAKKVEEEWKITQRISLPQETWNGYRSGLTGNRWLKVEERRDENGKVIKKGRILLHGVNKITRKYAEPLSETAKDYVDSFEEAIIPGESENFFEYAFGLAEFEWEGDFENVRLVGISKPPVLTYKQVKEAYVQYIEENPDKEFGNGHNGHSTEDIELNPDKNVIYTCDSGIEEGNRIKNLTTFGDKYTLDSSFSTQYLENFPLERLN